MVCRTSHTRGNADTHPDLSKSRSPSEVPFSCAPPRDVGARFDANAAPVQTPPADGGYLQLSATLLAYGLCRYA